MKMQAAILRAVGAPAPYADSQPIRIEEVELEGPRDGEVLVRIGGGGLCHSDLSVINGNRPRPVPVALGHEGAGTVVEVGPGVRDIRPDDRIVFQFSASCGRCGRCLEGRPNICELHAVARAKGELMGGGRRITDGDGVAVAHQSGVSCFAEYAVVDRGSVVRIDAEIPETTAAIFGCGVMTGVGAVLNTGRVGPGDTVAIIGLGGVGLNGLMGAAVAGAGRIIAVDVNPAKLGLARQLGAHETVDAREADHAERVREMTGGGVDVAVELAGSVKALETSYRLLKRGGTLVTAGLAPAKEMFSFLPADLVTDEKAILGSYMGGCVPVRDIPRYVDLYLQGKLPVDKLIDGTLGLDGINAGFDRLSEGEAIRQILTPHAA